jgi:hypothetical protein
VAVQALEVGSGPGGQGAKPVSVRPGPTPGQHD